MDFTLEFYAYASVTMGAVVMAAFFDPNERREALLSAALLVASWLLSLSSYTPWAPEKLLTAIGYPTTHLDQWAAINALTGCMIAFLAYEYLWGRVLFSLLILACANDTLRWLGLGLWKTSHPFLEIADVLFLARIALFFAIGGPNARDFIANHALRSRLFGMGRLLQPSQALKRRGL